MFHDNEQSVKNWGWIRIDWTMTFCRQLTTKGYNSCTALSDCHSQHFCKSSPNSYLEYILNLITRSESEAAYDLLAKQYAYFSTWHGSVVVATVYSLSLLKRLPPTYLLIHGLDLWDDVSATNRWTSQWVTLALRGNCGLINQALYLWRRRKNMSDVETKSFFVLRLHGHRHIYVALACPYWNYRCLEMDAIWIFLWKLAQVFFNSVTIDSVLWLLICVPLVPTHFCSLKAKS